MPPRKTDTDKYEYGEGILQACRAIVGRMEEGESWRDALDEDMDPKAHSEMSSARVDGFLGVFSRLQHGAELDEMV